MFNSQAIVKSCVLGYFYLFLSVYMQNIRNTSQYNAVMYKTITTDSN